MRVDRVDEESLVVLVLKEACQRLVLLARNLLQFDAVLHESLLLFDLNLLGKQHGELVLRGLARVFSHRGGGYEDLVNQCVVLQDVLRTEVILEDFNCHLQKFLVVSQDRRWQGPVRRAKCGP